MFKNFPKINTFLIAIFVFGVMLGFLSGIGIGIKYFFENKTFVPEPTECQPVECQPQEETRNVTGSVKFRSCLSDTKGQCSGSVENVLLAIVGQNGKIIKTIATDKNGEAEIIITVPVDSLFSLVSKMSAERGVINVVSFKEE